MKPQGLFTLVFTGPSHPSERQEVKHTIHYQHHWICYFLLTHPAIPLPQTQLLSSASVRTCTRTHTPLTQSSLNRSLFQPAPHPAAHQGFTHGILSLGNFWMSFSVRFWKEETHDRQVKAHRRGPGQVAKKGADREPQSLQCPQLYQGILKLESQAKFPEL